MRRDRRSTLVAILGLFFVVFLLPVSANNAAAATTGGHGTTGLIVPLYGYPGSDWNNLIWAKSVNPNVPMVAVVNPDDGPGSSQDPHFAVGIHRLQSAGVVVLGYVWTAYTARSMSSVEADIAAYRNLYGVNGVYVDQMSNIRGHESYYSALTAYAESVGMTIIVGNPGATVPSSYIGTVTTIVAYENSGAPSLALLSGLDSAVAKTNFAFVAYGVPSFTTAYLDSAANYVGYVYLTDGVMPNPYAPESSYLDNLATALDAYDQANSGPAPSPNAGSGTTPGSITVTTVDRNGDVIRGLYTSLWQNGARVASCFSPCTMGVNGGQSYQVVVSDYGSYTFSQWGNGLTSRYFPVSEPSSATQLSLWAVYNT